MLKSLLIFILVLSLSLLFAHATISVTETTLGPKCSGPLTPKTGLSSMWIETIKHEGTAPYNGNPSSYPIYRNVKDYGAKGDGVTDDTAAIQAAVAAGDRCGLGCDSSTVAPALVFFPQGTYVISTPIIMYYFTQMVGDALNPPTLLAAPSFSGIAVLDSDPYLSGGANWYTNQNNFYRQVRNFIIDLTHVTGGATGIHWQVAQATSLTNIVFNIGDQHQGIFMENGSGGFFSDLIFNGGKLGMWIGNQQFTARNITVNNAQTAIYVGWDWAWTFKDLYINNCGLGVDISAGGASAEGVGSVIILDAVFTNTPVGINTVTSSSSQPKSGGSLILDNVQFSNVPNAVQDVTSGTVILAGPGSGQTTTVQSWGQGQFYNSNSGSGSFTQGNLTPPNKNAAILKSGANTIFARPRPQYEQYDVSDFVSVKDNGAKGDGVTDDTNAIQQTLTQYAGCKIIYFPAGIYILTNTITIPAGSKIVGETWSVLSATGSEFADEADLKPMVKVGNSGDVGSVEISDILFSTHGPVPGAVLLEWNIRDPDGQQGASAMWDSHFRIGGALGTNLETAQCVKQSGVSSNCNGAFLSFHLTASSSAYLENVWVWTADHDLDGDHSQLSIYNGRGILIESSSGPVWMYGTASEHHVMYQYNIANAQNVFMGMIQIETPYYQSVPKAPLPFASNNQVNDPNWNSCSSTSTTCAMAWGFRVVNSKNIYLYGAGLYSFFQNYDQTCLQTEHCQDAMVSLEGSNSELYIYNLNTKGANSMLDIDGSSLILQADNRNGFCATVAGVLAEAGVNGSNSQFWAEEIRTFLG